jgi:hypothetical protein
MRVLLVEVLRLDGRLVSLGHACFLLSVVKVLRLDVRLVSLSTVFPW